MKKRSTITVMQGAALLSVASLFAKILSAIYRVPFQNMVGNTGFYVYQQIYPLYGLGMVVALNGLPMFISKLVAETPQIGARRGLLFQVSLLLSGFFVVVFGLLQLGAPILAQGMGDPNLTPIIQAVSWMFLTAPFLAVSRGLFQGQFNMVPTATSQLVEQLVRVTVILGVAYVAVTHHWSVYLMGTWAMSSAAVAAVMACLVMALYLLFGRSKKQPDMVFEATYHTVAKRILIEGGTISLLASIMVLLQLVDSFTVMKGLIAGGLSESAAKALKGVFDRGQPLVQLGLVVATAMASSLLPGLTDALSHRRHQQFVRLARTVLKIGFVIATASAMGMVALMPEINQLLFGDGSESGALSIYVLAVIFATLIAILNSILQSQGRLQDSLLALFVGLLVKTLLTPYLVKQQGLNGASWATVIALILMTVILIRRLPNLKPALLNCLLWVKLSIASLVMVIGVRLLAICLEAILSSGPVSGRVLALVVTLMGIPVGVLLFIRLAVKLRLLTTREWLAVPYAAKILKRWRR